MDSKPKLEDLSKEDLIARIYALEALVPPASRPHRRSQADQPKPFPFNKHPTRKIALKFSYAGWAYNGLAAQAQPTPLPTVEQVLFDALVSARLVDPAGGMDGCGWSRCGRTDRGVSAAGQVVSLRVRSAVGAVASVRAELEAEPEAKTENDDSNTIELDSELPLELSPPPSPPRARPETELAYVHILNRILPPTVRVLAWSPVSETFDARFSCQFRHYKYFFPSRGLDVSAMRDATQRLVGEHDFRNFCKLDPSKQIENFSRRVLGAWIEQVDRDWPTPGERREEGVVIEQGEDEMFVFNLRGTAFLWHQVRCIVAILFLIGQRLEEPSLIDHLLHTSSVSSKVTALPDSPPVEAKPNYTLADGLPLVLWDCGYKPEDVTWQTDAQLETQAGAITDRERTHNFWYQLYSIWTHDRIQTTMQHYFLRAAQVFYPPPSESGLPDPSSGDLARDLGPFKINTGGGMFRHVTKYVPVLELDRGERAEVANQKWREGAGGQRRMAKRAAKRWQAEALDERCGERA